MTTLNLFYSENIQSQFELNNEYSLGLVVSINKMIHFWQNVQSFYLIIFLHSDPRVSDITEHRLLIFLHVFRHCPVLWLKYSISNDKCSEIFSLFWKMFISIKFQGLFSQCTTTCCTKYYTHIAYRDRLKALRYHYTWYSINIHIIKNTYVLSNLKFCQTKL